MFTTKPRADTSIKNKAGDSHDFQSLTFVDSGESIQVRNPSSFLFAPVAVLSAAKTNFVKVK